MPTTYDVTTGRVHFFGLAREVVRDGYAHLPRVLAVSFVWSLLAVTVVLAAPATAVAFAAARSTLMHEPFGLRAAVRAFRRYFWRAQAAFVPAFLLVNAAGWLWLRAAATGDWLLGVLAFVAFDGLVVYAYLLLYYGPLLVDDGLRQAVRMEGSSPPTALELGRASATIALSRVSVSVGLALFVVSMGILLAFTVAGFVLLAPVVLAATLLLAARYLAGEPAE